MTSLSQPSTPVPSSQSRAWSPSATIAKEGDEESSVRGPIDLDDVQTGKSPIVPAAAAGIRIPSAASPKEDSGDENEMDDDFWKSPREALRAASAADCGEKQNGSAKSRTDVETGERQERQPTNQPMAYSENDTTSADRPAADRRNNSSARPGSSAKSTTKNEPRSAVVAWTYPDSEVNNGDVRDVDTPNVSGVVSQAAAADRPAVGLNETEDDEGRQCDEESPPSECELPAVSRSSSFASRWATRVGGGGGHNRSRAGSGDDDEQVELDDMMRAVSRIGSQWTSDGSTDEREPSIRQSSSSRTEGRREQESSVDGPIDDAGSSQSR